MSYAPAVARIRWSSLRGTLSADISDSDTTIDAAAMADFPEVTAPDVMVVFLDPTGLTGDPEILYVTSHALGDTIATVTRGEEQQFGGAVPRAHLSGTILRHGPTPGDFLPDGWLPHARLAYTTPQTLTGLPAGADDGDTVLLAGQADTADNGPWTARTTAWARPPWWTGSFIPGERIIVTLDDPADSEWRYTGDDTWERLPIVDWELGVGDYPGGGTVYEDLSTYRGQSFTGYGPSGTSLTITDIPPPTGRGIFTINLLNTSGSGSISIFIGIVTDGYGSNTWTTDADYLSITLVGGYDGTDYVWYVASVFPADISASLAALTTVQTFSNAAVTIVTSAPRTIVRQTGTLSAARVATLPAASAVPAGAEVIIQGGLGLSTTNTLSVARAGSDTINGGTSSLVMTTPYAWRRLISDGASAWVVDAGLLRSSDIGVLVPPMTTPVSALTPTTGTVNLDMAAVDGTYLTHALSGAPTFTTSNRATGRTVTARVVCDGTTRALTFPAWVFVGAAAPSSIAASKTAILTVTFFGTADTDAVAAWSVQP